MLPTDTAYVCRNMYIWNTQKIREYQICEMCVFSAVVVVLLRPYFFAELVGNVNTEKKKKQREANSSAGKECTVGSISLQARELTTLGEFRIPGKGSWQPHSSAAVRTNQGASVLAPHLVLALQVTAKQPADKTQKLLYSIEHKMPVLITSSFIRNQYRSEDTQPKSAINISSVHVK